MSSPLSPFKISPPLLNSSNPWATTKSDLHALYHCPHTGAVTLRTSLLSQGFSQSPSTHQYTFFSPTTGHSISAIDTSSFSEGRGEVKDGEGSSLNTLGYSPFPLETYLNILVELQKSEKLEIHGRETPKPFIVSVTGTADEIARCYKLLSQTLSENPGLDLMMEINLSCPNIPSKPPPAYDFKSLGEYLREIGNVKVETAGKGEYAPLHVGIKTPPYTYQAQFVSLITALETHTSSTTEPPISFITATNTLGSCLVLTEDGKPALGSANGEGIGGMAGEALHPLALGNVKTIRGLLDASKNSGVRNIQIVGVGGVSDERGYERMRGVGAAVVGVGTALGREGVGVFEKIAGGLPKE